MYSTQRSFYCLALAVCGHACGYGADEPEALRAQLNAAAAVSYEAMARTALVREAARAIAGPNSVLTSSWPESALYAGYPYITEDPMAWQHVLEWYGARLTSCKRDGYGYAYYPCCLNFGPSVVASYASQSGPRNCSDGETHFHGGQCKAFVNMLAYRSGVYRRADGGFKPLPTDNEIRFGDAVDYPWATRATIAVGDILRYVGPANEAHALVVVKKISSSRYIVVDSNWVGGEGREIIGSHEMTFSGKGVANLGNYRVLACVYSGRC